MHYPTPDEPKQQTSPSAPTPAPTGPATNTPTPAGLLPRAVQAVEHGTGVQYVKTLLQGQHQAGKTAAQGAKEAGKRHNEGGEDTIQGA